MYGQSSAMEMLMAIIAQDLEVIIVMVCSPEEARGIENQDEERVGASGNIGIGKRRYSTP